jgi:ParB/RepB/Spo0J family partition protein
MSENVRNIPIDLLIPTFILLRLVDRTSLDYIELRDSVAAHGLFSAICVRESIRQSGKYEIIDGLHRYCVSVDCGLTEIPCVIKEATDAEVKNWQIQANLLRRETANSEYATRLRMMFIENPELTMEILSVQLHCRPGRIQDILRLNQLIPEAKKQLDVGNLPLTSAYALSRVPKQFQDDLLDNALALTASNFISLCNNYRKDYRTALESGRVQDYLDPELHDSPHLRKLSKIKDEYYKPLVGKVMIEDLKLKTPIEIWTAALAWVLHLDPESKKHLLELATIRADIDKRKLLHRINANNKDHRRQSEARKLGIDTSKPENQDSVDLFLY